MNKKSLKALHRHIREQEVLIRSLMSRAKCADDRARLYKRALSQSRKIVELQGKQLRKNNRHIHILQRSIFKVGTN